MSDTAVQDTVSAALPRYPLRFNFDPERAFRLGHLLRHQLGDEPLDPALLDLVGQGLWEDDPVGAALFEAMRLPAADPRRVTTEQFESAVEHGVGSIADAPPALLDFFAVVDEVPQWVDFALLDRGAKVLSSFGENVRFVKRFAFGYGAPTDVMEAGGGNGPEVAEHRVAYTSEFLRAALTPGGMRRYGVAWKFVTRVRLMHARLNHQITARGWDLRRSGVPINQTDLASAISRGVANTLLALRTVGVRITDEDSRAAIHLWKYIGHVIGVRPEYLWDTEREENRFSCHYLYTNADSTSPPEQMAEVSRNAIDAYLRQRGEDRRRLRRLRGAVVRWQLLSAMSHWHGRTEVELMGLPWRSPIGLYTIRASNRLRYLLTRSYGGLVGGSGNHTS